MTATLKSVHFILGPNAGQDYIRSAFDAAREIVRSRAFDCTVHLHHCPFADWIAPLREVRTVWLKNFLPMIFQPIAISKALSTDGGNLIFASADRQMELARMASKLAGCESSSQIVSMPRICFAYPPLLSPPVAPQQPTVIYFGEITSGSGLDALIRALKDEDCCGWLLKVAGTGTARTVMPLVRLAKSLGVESRIHWAGDIDDISEVISASSVAYISDSQSWKRPTASGCGIPVISSPGQLSAVPSQEEYTPYAEIIRALIDKYSEG